MDVSLTRISHEAEKRVSKFGARFSFGVRDWAWQAARGRLDLLTPVGWAFFAPRPVLRSALKAGLKTRDPRPV